MRSLLLCLVSAGAYLSGCGGGGTSDPAVSIGSCDPVYASPVLVLSAVKDVASGRAIPAVTISSITVRGFNADLRQMLVESSGLALFADGLLCTAPCSFSYSEGDYVLSLKADGYLDKNVAVTARYSSLTGSCPVVISGPTAVSIEMAPRSP